MVRFLHSKVRFLPSKAHGFAALLFTALLIARGSAALSVSVARDINDAFAALAGPSANTATVGVRSSVYSIDGLEAPLHCLEAGPLASKQLVVFLHGAAFSAATWKETGALAALGSAGFRALAVDLPGFGAGLSGKRRLLPRQRHTLVTLLLDALLWPPDRRFVLVAASMGGTFASTFAVHSAVRLAGYVSISALIDAELAPPRFDSSVSSNAEEEEEVVRRGETPLSGSSSSCGLHETPTLMLWGELDSPHGARAKATRALFPCSEQRVFPHAPHACYVASRGGDPKALVALLLDFCGAAAAEHEEKAAHSGGRLRVAAAASSEVWVPSTLTVRARW